MADVESLDDSLTTRPARAVALEVDADGIIIDVSENCEALLGWTRQELLDTPLLRIIPERHHDAHAAGFAAFLETGEMPLEGQRPRLPARHAVIGEIEVALELRRADPDERGVAVGILEPIRRSASASDHDELTRAIQHAIGDNLPLSQLLHNCVGVAARQHGWRVASVWWVDPWLDRLRVIATWEEARGAYPIYVESTSEQVIARGEGIVGSVWSLGVPTYHGDLAAEPEMLRPVGSDGLHAALFVPLSDGDFVVGVVEMLGDEPREFAPDEHEAIWVLADELGRLLAERLRREHEVVQRERVQMALSAGNMGVWSYHVATGIITWDDQLEALHGFEPGEFGGDLDAFRAVVHPDDRAEVMSQFAGAIDGSGAFDSEFRTLTVDGRRLWIQTATAPLTDTEGTMQALTGVAFEITERVESERQLQARTREAALAAAVGRALVSRDPLADRLHATAEAVVSQVDAAFARIWVLPPGGDTLELHASAGLYTHLDGAHARIKVGEFKIGRIASSREPHLTNQVLHDPLLSDPEWARSEEMVAFAGYPLIVGDLLVGVLGLFARRPLPETTLSSLSAVSDTIAIAILQDWSLREMEGLIAQAQQHAADMEDAMRDRAHVAQVLQRSLLPPSLPEVPGVALAAEYRAGVEEVGGDFYDVIPVRSRWGFMIGDVCGRGPEAARLTALSRHSLRTAMLLDRGPADALGALNESLLAADNDLRFCTAACGTFASGGDPGAGLTVRISVGGHPLPRVLRVGGDVERVGTPGTLLGVVDQPTHHDTEVVLAPGDTMILFTDGVTEASRSGEHFGDDRLDAAISAQAGRHPHLVVEAIIAAVTDHASEANDDLAILAFAAVATDG